MSLNYAVLGLLQYRDMHGYRIKEHLENNFGHMWSVNFGQIYPILKDLEKKASSGCLKYYPPAIRDHSESCIQ